ncbi:hypothetical protein [Burkholderia sp. TSV86]|uniref:hypothetical protein n=1 Tax=Burkholderia sp. TSV86 TaxID=1385594 RepID=UPI000A5DC260|nr:hypothetical protein [Burkholderia sp. TSV86]
MSDATEQISKQAERPMDEQTARTILRGSGGWIVWNGFRDCPDWSNGQIQLDGRFSMDELRAILAFARKSG